MSKKMARVNILDEVIWHLKHTRVPLKRIALDMGIHKRYLYKLMTGETANPQFNELNRVYVYFIKHPKSRGRK